MGRRRHDEVAPTRLCTSISRCTSPSDAAATTTPRFIERLFDAILAGRHHYLISRCFAIPPRQKHAMMRLTNILTAMLIAQRRTSRRQVIDTDAAYWLL